MKNAVGRCGNKCAKARAAKSACGLFPSKKKKEIRGIMTRCCCGPNNERAGSKFPSPLIIGYRQHGDENTLDTKTSGAALPREGNRGLRCVIPNPNGPRTCQNRRLRLFRADGDMPSPLSSSLDVDEKVSFQDVLALLVLLCRIVGSVLKSNHFISRLVRHIRAKSAHIFPPEGHSALDAIYISYGVVAGRHLAITGFPFNDVYPTGVYRVSFYARVERSARGDLTLPQRDMLCRVGH